MAALTARVERIEKAVESNTCVFSDGIKILEIQRSLAFRIMQDVFNGAVRVGNTVSNDDGVLRAEVDVQSYIREHLEALTQLEEAPKEEKAGPGPLLASVDDEQPITFGGDFGS